MRKSLWVAALVTVLCVALGVTGFVRLNESGKQVQFEETVLFGDKTAIDGLKVRHQLYTPVESGYLYWDTAYWLAEGTAETEYIYREKKLETSVEDSEFLNFGTYTSVAMQASGTIDLRKEGGEWAPILVDVAERAGTETSYSKRVNLKDYFEYSPMFFEVKIGTLNYSSRYNAGDSDMEQWIKVLQNEFRIPVPEKSYAMVEISKRTGGSINQYRVSAVGIPYVYSYSLVTEKHCYLLVNVRVSDEKYADSSLGTELVEKYQGIYRIPYETVAGEQSGESDEKTILHTEQMEKLASMDSEIIVENMRYDKKWDRIELIYHESCEDEYPPLKMMVFDAKTGETVQAMTLVDREEDVWISEIYCHDDFIVITMRDLRQDGRRGFTLLSRGADGRYQIEFEGDFPEKEVTDNEIWLKIYDPQYAVSMDFDGERLVMGAVVDGFLGDSRHPGLFQIIVYEAGEVIFHGQYQSSLVIGEDIVDGCQHREWTPIRVSWD